MQKTQYQKIIGSILFIITVGAVGFILLGLSRAATNTSSLQTESGTVSGNASVVSDSTAAGLKAVRFGGIVANAIIVSPSGSDTSGSGTTAAPYKTVTKAQSIATAGSTIYLRAGTYAGTVNLTRSGTANNPITYSGYPGETAVINGSSGTYYGEGVLYLKNLQYVTVQNMTLQNGSGQGIKVENSNNIVIANTIVHDIQLGGLVVSGNNIMVSGNEVYNVAETNTNGSLGSGGWPASVSSERTPSGTTSTNVSFINNYSHDNWGEGIDAWFDAGGTLDGNRSSNNYSVNIYIDDSKNLNITNNYVAVTNSVHNRSDNGHPPTGIAFNSETGTQAPINMIVNGNTLSGNLNAGIIDLLRGGTNITQSPNPQNF